MTTPATIAVVMRRHTSSRSYTLARMVTIDGVTYGQPIVDTAPTPWPVTFHAKGKAFAAARAFGNVRPELYCEDLLVPSVHALITDAAHEARRAAAEAASRTAARARLGLTAETLRDDHRNAVAQRVGDVAP